MPQLTARQQQILDCIQTAIARTGAPPTRAEIAAEFGFKSANAAEDHLQALARKGVIELVSGTSRGIRLCSGAMRSLSAAQGTLLPASLAGVTQLVLPLVAQVATGAPMLAPAHIGGTYCVESTLFQSKPDYLLKMHGMSMRGAGILDGDLLAVQSARTGHNGQLIVARLNGEVVIKRLRRTARGLELLADSSDCPSISVLASDAFDIEGIAVGLIRNGGTL